MKKYGIIGAIALAVVAAGVWGWSTLMGRDDSMASSLPSDVTMVGRVDMKKLSIDYGLDLANLKELFLNDKDEAKTGLKLQTTAYVFASQGYFGAIVAVDNDDDFEAYLKKQGIDIEEQRGVKWAVANGNILMAFGDDRVMFMGPAVGTEQEALRNTIYNCMKQKVSESGKQSRLYKLLDECREPVALTGNLGAIPREVISDAFPFGKEALSSLEDLDITAALTVRKDRIALSFRQTTENKELNKLMDKTDNVFGKVDGDLLRTMPVAPLFHLAMNIDGEDLLERLREDHSTRTLLLGLNMVLDLDMILKSIDGDVALTCPEYTGENLPALMLQAELEDDKFMKKVKDWNDAAAHAIGLSFYSLDRNNALCSFAGQTIYFGTRDRRLTVANVESLVKEESRTDMKPNFASEMKGNRLYAVFNLNKLRPLLGRLLPQNELLFDDFDRLTLSVPEVREVRFELVTRDGVEVLKALKDLRND